MHISITNLLPSRLWLLKLAVKLVGATIVVCKGKSRRVEHDPQNTTATYRYDPSMSSSTDAQHSVG